MKKLTALLLLVLMAGMFAAPAFAQEGGAAAGAAAGKPPEKVAMWIAIASGFSMAIAAAFAGLAQSRVASAACEGMARNPGAAADIRGAMILALVFIETMALFTLAIVFAKVTY